MLLLMK